MVNLPDQALWVWIVLGMSVAGSAYWANVRPGSGSARGFAPAIGAVIILFLLVFFRGVALGDLPLRF